MEYNVLVSQSLQRLIAKVNTAGDDDWRPCGGVEIAVNIGGPGVVRYHQAMVRKPPVQKILPEDVDATKKAKALAKEHGLDLTQHYQGKRLTYWNVQNFVDDMENGNAS